MGSGQSRTHGVDETDESQGCCSCFAKAVLSFLIALSLLASFGLAVSALVTGKDQFWAGYASKDGQQPYKIQTGWFWFTVNGDTSQRQSLTDVAYELWVLGLVAAAVLAAAALVALAIVIVLGFGHGGRGLFCPALSIGYKARVDVRRVVSVGVVAAYYAVAAVTVRSYTYKTQKTAYLVWPSWSWCLGLGASLLWVLVGLFARGYPRKRVYRKQISPRPSPMPREKPGLERFGEDVENRGPQQATQPPARETELPQRKRSLFGRTPKPPSEPLSAKAHQAYHEQTDDIAERYAPQR